MREQTRNFSRAILQGATDAGLFHKPTYPGAPTKADTWEIEVVPVEVVENPVESDPDKNSSGLRN